MDILSSNALLVFIIAIPIAVFCLVLVLFLLFRNYYGKYQAKMSEEDELKNLLVPETVTDDDDSKKRNSTWRKWNRYWEKRLVDSGLNIAGIDRYNAGKAILIIDLVLVCLLSFVFKGMVVGAVLVTVVLTGIMSLVLGFKANKKQEKLSGQVPAFLSALRAANQTNGSIRTAMMQAIATTPTELHEELKPIEDQLKAGSSVKQTLSEYYEITTIDELRFLMACVILVCDVGRDITEELEIISDVVDKRMEVERHLKTAIAQVMPTVWVATLMIPALFLYTYISQPIARQFWFHGLISWVLFIVVILLYAAGMLIAKKCIDKIKNL